MGCEQRCAPEEQQRMELAGWQPVATSLGMLTPSSAEISPVPSPLFFKCSGQDLRVYFKARITSTVKYILSQLIF